MFAKRLKILRKEKKISQKELGIYLGLSPSAVGMYESRNRKPDIDTLKKISEYFQVSVDFLLGFTDIKKLPEALEKAVTKAYCLFGVEDLPDEAIKQVEDYVELIKLKYKK